MTLRRIALAAGAALVPFACRPHADTAALRAGLMDADRAFAAATAERGVDGWVAWFDEDGRQYHARGVSVGPDSIRARMAVAFADTTRRLVWHPVTAEVAASGDLGYTLGRWESRVREPGGAWRATGSGGYVTVWRRQADGSWRVAVDVGNQDP